MAEIRVFLRAHAHAAPFARRRLALLLAVASITIPLMPSVWRAAHAAPMTLTFESTPAASVVLGTLSSRSQCGALTKQGVGPYTMSGTDSRSGLPYSYVTNSNYSGAQLNESKEATPSMSFSRTTGVTYSGKSGVLQLNSGGSITWGNSCLGKSVYGSAFGPEVYTAAFQATAGQALSFNWAAAGGGDDYEVYAFLVKVNPSGATFDYGGTGSELLANTTLLAHGRGTTQAWTTSTGSIPADGYYRFRFVNGSFDATGGKALGANMYIDPSVLVGQANSISFGTLSDKVTSGSNQTFTVSASATSGGTVTFASSTTGRCTVGASTDSGGSSTATVTLLANQTGLCTISADSASVGDYATASTVTRSFTILAAPTAPTNSGGTAVSGSSTVGATLTAADGSWADGGSVITATSYQWQVCPVPASCSWSNIAAATGPTYEVQAADVGKQVRVVVTKTNSIGSTSVNSTSSATVSKGSQATLLVSTTNATYGQTLSLATSGGSGTGAVTWSVVSGTCSVSGSTLTPGDPGSACVVSATKAADSAFNSATSANTTITVGKASQSTLTVTSVSGVMGVPLVLASSGGSGTGAVSWERVAGSCTVTGSSLTPTAAGSSCTVRATKAADGNYQSQVSADTTVTFAKGAQTTLVVSTTNATYGQTLSLTTSGGNGTGAVSWSVVSGMCSVAGSFLTPGNAGSSCVVRATKAEDDNYLAQSSTNTSISTAKAAQNNLVVTTVTATYGQSLALGTTGGSGTGAVTWTKVSGMCSVSGSMLTPGDVGTSCVVKATKATDTNYLEVSSVNTSVTVSKGSQTGFSITSPASFTTGTPLPLTASGGQSSGLLSWSVSSGACTISGSSLSAARGGISCVVEVTRAGDSNWQSVSDTQTVSVNKITQNLTFRSVAPSPANPGGTYTVSVDSDAFLAPTIVIANQSASVCSINAGVVSFSAVGTCLISASQAGNDVYSAAAASQSVSVVAVAAAAPAATPPPVSLPTVTTTTVVSTQSAPTVPAVTTTVPSASPQSTAAAPVTTQPAATATTTTTTTTIPVASDPGAPNAGIDGKLPELEAGETTAIVRGEAVKAIVETQDGQLTVTLPNDVVVKIGSSRGKPGIASVSADGVLRAFRESQVEVQAQGFQSGTTFTVYLFSDPFELARGNVERGGKVYEVVALPKEAKTGGHTLQVNGVGPNAEVVSVSLGIKIIAKDSNTAAAVIAISLAILLALLGGRPVFAGRRRRRDASEVR